MYTPARLGGKARIPSHQTTPVCAAARCYARGQIGRGLASAKFGILFKKITATWPIESLMHEHRLIERILTMLEREIASLEGRSDVPTTGHIRVG
ncbi:hypothetical protein DFAR_2360002 [Desulfarculales bacterium]